MAVHRANRLRHFLSELEDVLIDGVCTPREPLRLEERVDRPMISALPQCLNDPVPIGFHDRLVGRPRPRPECFGVPGL